MNDMKKLKADSYPADMSSKRRARRDRKKVKKFKNDPNKKICKWDEETRCWHYAESEEKLHNQIAALRNR